MSSTVWDEIFMEKTHVSGHVKSCKPCQAANSSQQAKYGQNTGNCASNVVMIIQVHLRYDVSLQFNQYLL